MSRLTNSQFARTNEVFREACKRVGLKPTGRQASKWRRRMGLAFKNSIGHIHEIAASLAFNRPRQ